MVRMSLVSIGCIEFAGAQGGADAGVATADRDDLTSDH